MSLEHEIAAWRLAAAAGTPFPFRGAGLSMWPTLRRGDIALCAPLCRPPRRGDILLFTTGRALIAHRLLAIRPDGLLCTRGDALRHADPPIDPAWVLGRVTAVVRAGRTHPLPGWTMLAHRLPGLVRSAIAGLGSLTAPGPASTVAGNGKSGG